MSRADSTTPTSGTSRGSYPSRQRRFGPAPLASFEDLPTDEAHSSSSSSSDDEKAALSSVRMACPQISLIITDHNEVEHPIETVHLPEYDRRRLHSATAATLNISDGKSGWCSLEEVSVVQLINFFSQVNQSGKAAGRTSFRWDGHRRPPKHESASSASSTLTSSVER